MGFWESQSKTIDAVVPLAMRKFELDTANARLQGQLDEAKRQHEFTTGMEWLKIGDTKQASKILKVDPSVLENLPGIKGMRAKERGSEYLLNKITPKTMGISEIPQETPGMGAGEMLGLRETGGFPGGENVTILGGNITFDDIVKASVISGDISGLAGILSKESTVENKERLADLKMKLAEMGQENLDRRLQTMLAIAGMNLGERRREFEATPRPAKMNETDKIKYEKLFDQKKVVLGNALLEDTDKQTQIAGIDAELDKIESKYMGKGTSPPAGFKDSGRTSGGKKVYVKGNQAWIAP